MKYRSTATQIKEIPIIFRGNLDPKAEKTIEKWVDFDDISGIESSGIYINMVNWASLAESDANDLMNYLDGQPEELHIRFDDEIIELPISDYIGSDGVYFGEIDADEESPTYGMPIFTDYPVVIGFNGAGVMFLFGDNSEHNINIRTGAETIYTSGFKRYEAELTGNGQIKRFHARFACGENGTLHLNPYVILNGNITIKLCDFAKGGDDYIAGDNEEISFDCYVPVETHALACLDVENVGEYPSIVDAAIVVQYEDFIEPESIVGYEGINLKRK